MSEVTKEIKVIKVGSRKSELALIQTNAVIKQLQKSYTMVQFEVVAMTTTGDNILDTALSKIGEKSLFTKELEVALLENRVDFVVHSLKDLPTELPHGLVIGAVCKRDDPRDAVVMRAGCDAVDLASLPADSVIGTSSLRRAAQLRRNFPHLKFSDVRGNLNTRLRKLDAEGGEYNALILAVAGMERMGWGVRISQILEPELCMYAIGQGAMAVECRLADTELLQFLSAINDDTTAIQCVCERAFLRRLEGGCSVPVAVYVEQKLDDELTLHGGVYSIDGTQAITGQLTVSLADNDLGQNSHHEGGCDGEGDRQFASIASEKVSSRRLALAERLGRDLAEKLMRDGATEILATAKRQTADEIRRKQAAKANSS